MDVIFLLFGMADLIDTVVIYHGGCPDGTSAAWCLSLALNNERTLYHYGKFGESPINVKDKKVIFVDFSYSVEVILKMLQEASSILVLDHHESAKKLSIITDPRFTLNLDMDRSGAQIAWDWIIRRRLVMSQSFTTARHFSPPSNESVDHFTPEELEEFINKNSVCRPWFINDIADRDLWRWIIPGSKDATKGLHHAGYHRHINNYFDLMTAIREEFILTGSILNKYDDDIINMIVGRALDCHAKTPLNIWRCRVVECDHTYASEVGNRLIQDGIVDFSIMYRYDLARDEWWISARADPKSNIDLTKILTLFDPKSGGHPKAAGMSIRGAEGNSLRTFFKPQAVKFIPEDLSDTMMRVA